MRRRMRMNDRLAGLSLAQGVEHKGVGPVLSRSLTLGAQSPTAILRPHFFELRRCNGHSSYYAVR